MHPKLSERLVSLQFQEALGMEGLFSERMQVEEYSYPLLFVRFINKRNVARLLRFDFTDYDFQAASVTPVNPDTRAALPPENWMLRGGGPFPPHPLLDNQPFLCFPGNRDYYTHSGHLPSLSGERWERWRSEMSLPDTLKRIAHKFDTGEWE